MAFGGRPGEREDRSKGDMEICLVNHRAALLTLFDTNVNVTQP